MAINGFTSMKLLAVEQYEYFQRVTISDQADISYIGHISFSCRVATFSNMVTTKLIFREP
jgi:hypothetical protein